jgi:hypothetical protein
MPKSRTALRTVKWAAPCPLLLLELYKRLLRESGWRPNALREYCGILESICECLQDQPAPDKAALQERTVSLRTGRGLQTHPEDLKACIQFIYTMKLFLLQKDERGVVTSMGLKKNINQDTLRPKLIRFLYHLILKQTPVDRSLVHAALLEEGEADGWRERIEEALREGAAEPAPLQRPVEGPGARGAEGQPLADERPAPAHSNKE